MNRITSKTGITGAFLMIAIGCVAIGSIQARAQNKQDNLRAERPGENVILDVPAGVELKAMGSIGLLMPKVDDKSVTEVTFSQGATLTWANGMRLQVRGAPVSIVRAGRGGPTRVYIQRKTDAPK